MALKVVVDSLDNVPEGARDQYRESTEGGKAVYTLDIEGKLDGHPLARTILSENKTYRERISATNATLTAWKPVMERFQKPDEAQALLDKLPELELAAAGKVDEKALDTMVEARVRSKLAPVERERDQWKTRASELENANTELTAKERRRLVVGAVGSAARALKVRDTAYEDVELYGERLFEVDDGGNVVTKDGVGVTPGLSPKAWLEDMQPKRPHWWGDSAGGGAGGSRSGGGTVVGNPWAHDTWNLSKQGEIQRDPNGGAERAARMAAAAGSVNGRRPPAPVKK